MKNKLLWVISIFFLLTISLNFVNAYWTPQEDINLRNVYQIINVTNISASYYCNATSCYTVTQFLVDTDTDTTYDAGGVYIYLNGSNYFILNETKLNATISSLAPSYTNLSQLVDDLGARGYTHLTNFTDDLGDRGYTSLSNFSNDPGFYNQTNVNASELQHQGDGKLGILDSFINLLIDDRVIQAFVKALGFYDDTEVYNKSETYNRTEIDSNFSNYILTSEEGNLDVNSSTWWAGVSGWVSGWFTQTGNDLDFNETKLNDTIDARDSDTTYTNGSGLSLVGTEFNHTDTSSQASDDNSGNTFIQDIILDTFGHITGLTNAGVDFSAYAAIADLVGYLGNWSADQDNYYNKTYVYNKTEVYSQAEVLAFGYYNSTDFVITDYFTKADVLGFSYYNATDFDIADYYNTTDILAFGYYNSSDFDIADYLTAATILGFGYYNSTDFTISDYSTTATILGWSYYNITDFDIADYYTSSQVDTALAGQDQCSEITGCLESAAINASIDDRENDTFVNADCAAGQFVQNISGGDTLECAAPAGGGDITGVYGDNIYIYNGSASGEVTLALNETRLNITIDDRAGADGQKNTTGFYLYNDTTTIYLNETQLNITINSLENDTLYYAGGIYIYKNASDFFILNETYLNATINALENDTTYTNGTAISLVGTQFNLTTCGDDEVWKMNGAVWNCEADAGTAYTNGSGISIVGSEINHSDTSSQASDENSGNTFIQDIVLDTFGHITSIVNAAVDFSAYVAIANLVGLVGNWSADKSDYWNTSTDLDTVISADEILEANINFTTACAAGSHYYLSGNDLACETDDDTTYTASGVLLDLTGQVFSVNNGTLTTTKGCKYVSGTGIVCDQDYLTSYTESDPMWTGNQSSYSTTATILGWSYWNDTSATFNKTYADTLYYGIANPSAYWNSTFATFNKTYADTLYEGAAAHFDVETTVNITCLDSACNWYANATDSCMYWPSGGKDCGAA